VAVASVSTVSLVLDPADIPQRGLTEVLSAWSGQGEVLLEALAAVSADDLSERAWTSLSIRRRAHRVLFGELIPMIAHWPDSPQGWINALPAETIKRREIVLAPVSGVSWRETRRLFDWPPKAFMVRSRNRAADSLLVTTLKWTLARLGDVHRDAIAVVAGLDAPIAGKLNAALSLLSMPPLIDAEDIQPARQDIAALSREGSPWNLVAPVTEALASVSSSIEELARRLILPDESLRWRLFHLAVLGEVLAALKNLGCSVRSLRPLSASSSGPAYSVIDPKGRTWDLWFEAGGASSFYGKKSPYLAATAGLGEGNRPIGADIMLVRSDKEAFIIECKFTRNPATVGGGVSQSFGYGVEVQTALQVSTRCAVVAPTGATAFPTSVDTVIGRVDLLGPDDLAAVVEEVLITA
jgi:hypothetical protein